MKQNIRVLIVEDASFLREMLYRVLTEAGIEVVGNVQSMDEALSQIEALRPDLVLLDIVLPGENGITLAGKINQLYPEIEALVCSSLSQEQILMQSELVGAMGFIKKPFRSDEIVSAVFSAVEELKKEVAA